MYDIRYIDNNKVKVIFLIQGEVKRMLTIKVGDILFVEPDNPLKMIDRGRECAVKDFFKNDLGHPIQAIVTFLDNGDSGQVDIRDLVVKAVTADSVLE